MTHLVPRYLDVVEVAKLVRRTLKGNFPGVNFSVRSHRYAGGASILVAWKEGPQESEVKTWVGGYEGSRIDGDFSPRPVSHYLRPDGKTMIAYNPSSLAVGAFDPEGEDNRSLGHLMPPDVELVRFGADFVLCYREPSEKEATEMERLFNEARANRDPDELPF